LVQCLFDAAPRRVWASSGRTEIFFEATTQRFAIEIFYHVSGANSHEAVLFACSSALKR